MFDFKKRDPAGVPAPDSTHSTLLADLLGLFRVKQSDGSVTNLIGQQVAALAADMAVTSNTTLAPTGLSLALGVGTYDFNALLLVASASAAVNQGKAQFGGTAVLSKATVRADGMSAISAGSNLSVPSSGNIGGILINSVSAFQTAFPINASTGTASISQAQLCGVITVTTAGTLTLSFAQNTSSFTAMSLLAGSSMRATQLF